MWTPEQRKEFSIAYALTCDFFDRKISTEFIQMVLSDLEGSRFDFCMKALSLYRLDNKNRFWPKSGDILAILRAIDIGIIDPTEIANEIYSLADKKGYNWHEGFFYDVSNRYWRGKGNVVFWNFEEAVNSYLGFNGFYYVSKLGGWQNITQAKQLTDRGQFIAQFRDILENALDKGAIESLSDRKSNYLKSNDNILTKIGTEIKTIDL
jgi:hypothetical protein